MVFKNTKSFKDFFEFTKEQFSSIFSTYIDQPKSEHKKKLSELKSQEFLSKGLITDLYKGLSTENLMEHERKETYGKIPKLVTKSTCEIILICFKNISKILFVLFLCSLVMMVLAVDIAEGDEKKTSWAGDFMLFLTSFVFLIIDFAFSFSTEKKSNDLIRFMAMFKSDLVFCVIRNGEERILEKESLLVGDVVKFSFGTEIPANGLIIQKSDVLEINESSLTGVSGTIKKETLSNYLENENFEVSPIVLAGSKIAEGNGTFLVLNFGNSVDLAENKEPENGLEKILKEDTAVFYGIIFSCLTGIILLIRFIVDRVDADSFEKEHVKQILEIVCVSLSIIWVSQYNFVWALATFMGSFVKLMIRDFSLVRNLSAVTKLNEIDTICIGINDVLDLRTQISQLHNGTTLFDKLQNANFSEYFSDEFSGKTMDNFVRSCNLDINFGELENNMANIKTKLKNKYVSTLITQEDSKELFIKGKSSVLNNCSYIYSYENNEVIPLEESKRFEISEAITKNEKMALLPIVFAYKNNFENENYNNNNENDENDEEEKDLVLLFVGFFRKTIKMTAPDAIHYFAQMGINVKLVSQEGKDYTSAVASVVSIDATNSISGEEFANLLEDSMEKFEKINPKLNIIYDINKNTKSKWIMCMNQLGYSCASFAENPNDVSSLKLSKIGFSKGISGSEVVKEISDIVILDDSLNSVFKSFFLGRRAKILLQNFFEFKLVALYATFLILLIGAFFNQIIFTPFQIIWTNLIIFWLLCVGFALEQLTQEEIFLKKKEKNFLTPKIKLNVLRQVTLQTILILIFVFAGEHIIPEISDDLDTLIKQGLLASSSFYTHYGYGIKYNVNNLERNETKLNTVCSGRYKDYLLKEKFWGPSRHFTFVFNLFVFLQLLNIVNYVKINCKNLSLVFIYFFVVGLQVLMVSVGSTAFSCYKWMPHPGLYWGQWLICIGICFFMYFTIKFNF